MCNEGSNMKIRLLEFADLCDRICESGMEIGGLWGMGNRLCSSEQVLKLRTLKGRANDAGEWEIARESRKRKIICSAVQP